MGSLSHFRRSRRPLEAGTVTKCADCALIESCPFSAEKIYIDDFFEANGELRGFQKTLTDVEDLAHIESALASTNYGTCVYELDNDLCDNQVVTMQYDAPYGPINVSFTMVAFSRDICVRKTIIYGTRGQIEAFGNNKITVYDFATDKETVHYTQDFKGSKESNSHGGGDFGLIRQFINAVAAVKNGADLSSAQRQYIGSTIEYICLSHAIVFAADKSRREGLIVHDI